MLKNKSKIITIVLLIMTVGLVVAIVYISQVITGEPEKGEANTNLAPQKTKAANISYQKTIAINNITPTLVPTAFIEETVTPTLSLTPGEGIITPTVTNTLLALKETNAASIAATVAPTGTELLTPSPTEILLAYNVTPGSGESYSSSVSATTVKTKTLPDSGFITNSIIMFVAAGLIIFFSFMF